MCFSHTHSFIVDIKFVCQVREAAQGYDLLAQTVHTKTTVAKISYKVKTLLHQTANNDIKKVVQHGSQRHNQSINFCGKSNNLFVLTELDK